MPAWWGKKSSKKQQNQPNHQQQTQFQNPNNQKQKQHLDDGNYHTDLSKASINNDKRRSRDNKNNNIKHRKSFDDVFAKSSPRNSREFSAGAANIAAAAGSGGSSGFCGFDSAAAERGHRLPRPSVLSSGNDHVVGLGSGSLSGSSLSSSVSSDDQVAHLDHAQLGISRGHFIPGPRSPGASSRGATTATSPLHPRLGGSSLDSPTAKLEDGKSEYHRLPLPPSSPPSPSALPTPRTFAVTENSHSNLSKWRKGRLLGKGTFGHVYLGFNIEGGHMCAIKEVTIIADDKTSKECLKQLNQEITLLSQLSHPNIVQYYGSELGEETLSVYLEYVSGGSIHKLLQEYGAFREPVIQNYTRKILSGLAYLHGRNTVHRDIKGANILVGPSGEVKLADFGMAKHITACSSMLSFKGSPYWIAPEVIMNTSGHGTGYSLAVDIWSLGCTILEMATSKPPWSQYEGVAAIFKIGNSKDIPEIPDHLSNDAKNFIRLCLQREPSTRPTASQLLDHPFVRDQATTRFVNASLTKEAFPSTSDGSQTPTTFELRSTRRNSGSSPLSMTPRAVTGPRDNARMITSLPVSPCSSPLRQYGPAYKSCYLSPPHPSFNKLTGQSGYNVNDFSMFPAKTNVKGSLDPWLDIPQFRAQTPPSRSPRRRPILETSPMH